ncbi:hypothetical protein EGY19_09565 [Burkholderia multivorans]|nr:hypothetical protein EGY19_09565 [Burkholderia multivorans]PRF47948.1 hypothetical protein C6Q04_14830 [Burkholderia multivorans]PRG12637.1 hypothetical protein C6Q21_07390 [Burkholderia multivorans]PRG46352.1 hypothetical protein C6T63_28865 [Burkholderia multivorans]
MGEYFISTTQPTAESNIDYVRSPLEEIRNLLNGWFAELGSQTRMECADSALFVAPVPRLSPEFIGGYAPFFKAIFLYQAHLVGSEDATPPSMDQLGAAYLGLANLMAALVPAPSPMLLEDGTIGGYWRRGRCYASIDFEVDGEHTWVETDGKEVRSGVWKLPGQPVPSALLHELLALAS